MKSMRPIFKTEILIYQSKANLDEQNLLGKFTHHLDQEIRKMLANWKFGNSILVHDLHAIEIRILSLKLTL